MTIEEEKWQPASRAWPLPEAAQPLMTIRWLNLLLLLPVSLLPDPNNV